MSARHVRSPVSSVPLAAAVWLLILVIPVNGRAEAGGPMALDVGNRWTYAGDDGDLVVTVTGHATVLGRTTARVVFDDGRADPIVEYLSVGPAGDLLLHARQGSGGRAEAFDPPLAWYAPGAETGHGAYVRRYARLDGSGGSVEMVYFIALMGREEITVPAGTFESCHVVELLTPGDARWYHPEGGLVQVSLAGQGAVYRLVGAEKAAAVEDATWSDMKAMFR